MADYIERKAVLDAIGKAMPSPSTPDFKGVQDYEAHIACEAFVDAATIVEKLPAANVREDLHGYWKGFTCSAFCGCDEFGDPVYRDATVYYCSECDRKTVIKENFCPNCGARMAGGGER